MNQAICMYTQIFLFKKWVKGKEKRGIWMEMDECFFSQRNKQEKLLGGVDKKEFHCFCVSDDAFAFLSHGSSCAAHWLLCISYTSEDRKYNTRLMVQTVGFNFSSSLFSFSCGCDCMCVCVLFSFSFKSYRRSVAEILKIADFWIP